MLSDNVEILVLFGAAVSGIGNSIDNIIYGTAIDNVLNGSGGGDVMVGRAGNDGYYVDNRFDAVVENPNEGTQDYVFAGVDHTLSTEIEILALTGTALNGTGNSSDNIVYGTAGNNVIDGGGADDSLLGGDGADTFVFTMTSNGRDIVVDYVPTVDFLRFSSQHYADANDVLNHSEQVGSNVVVTHDSFNVITLQNVMLNELSQNSSHFFFV